MPRPVDNSAALSRVDRRLVVAAFIAANGGSGFVLGRPASGRSSISADAIAALLGVSSAVIRADACRADVRAVVASILAGSISVGALFAAGVSTRYGIAVAVDAAPAAGRRSLPAVVAADAPGVDLLASDAAAAALANALRRL